MRNDNNSARLSQGNPSSPIQEWASRYRSLGFAISRIDAAKKKAIYFKWSTFSAEKNDFFSTDNIAIQGGWLSTGGRPGHAAVILDLDSQLALACADEFLPSTAMIEGRPSKPRAHRYYLVPVASIPEWATSHAEQAAAAAIVNGQHPGPLKKQFLDGEGKVAIDFLGTGGQAVAPPSLHSSGEIREWEGGIIGEPAVVDFLVLWTAVCKLAKAIGCRRPAACECAPGYDDQDPVDDDCRPNQNHKPQNDENPDSAEASTENTKTGGSVPFEHRLARAKNSSMNYFHVVVVQMITRNCSARLSNSIVGRFLF